MTTTDDDYPPPPYGRLGPCGICGVHPDQRHRIRDAIFERVAAGEDIEDVCRDYDWTPDQAMALHLDIDRTLCQYIDALEDKVTELSTYGGVIVERMRDEHLRPT